MVAIGHGSHRRTETHLPKLWMLFYFQALKYVSFPNVACFLHTCNMFGPKNSSEFLFVKHGHLLKDAFALLYGTIWKQTYHWFSSTKTTLVFFAHLIRLEVEIVNHLQQVETLLPKVAPDWSNAGNPTTFPGEVGTIYLDSTVASGVWDI